MTSLPLFAKNNKKKNQLYPFCFLGFHCHQRPPSLFSVKTQSRISKLAPSDLSHLRRIYLDFAGSTSPSPDLHQARVAVSNATNLSEGVHQCSLVVCCVSPLMTQRSKSKFVIAGPGRSAETLLKYISSDQIPVQYGRLSVDDCDCNSDFTIDDPAIEITVKPGTKQTVEIIIYEKCTTVWELRVVGWEVCYGAEFVPNNKDAYTIVIQKTKNISPTDEPVVYNSFKVSELGKVLLTIDNPTSKKKYLAYRFIIKPLSD